MKRALMLPLVVLFSVIPAISVLAIDFRGTTDNLNLMINCAKRSDPPKRIIQSCAFSLKSGFGSSGAGFQGDLLSAVLYRMGVAYRRDGNQDLANRHFGLAIQSLDKALTGLPNSAELHKGRCWYRAVQGQDLDGALADCDAARARAPDDPVIADFRGFALYRLGRYQDALQSYDASLSSRSDNPDAQFMRGLTKKKLGDAAGGEADLKAASRADSKIAEIYAGYGVSD
jgi:tetratricopeptide (TPR) repeat protein